MKRHTYEEIKRLHVIMAEELLATGLSARSVKIQELDVETVDEFDLDDAHRWIEEIRVGPFTAVLGIRSRHPAETWKNMKALGVKGLPEQKILRDRLLALRKAWMNERPEILFRAAKRKKGRRSPSKS